MGPAVARLVQDPLAVKLLDNGLSIQIDKYKNNSACNKFQECWNTGQIEKLMWLNQKKSLSLQETKKFLHWVHQK